MIEQGYGRIVHVAELTGTGVTVNIVRPGPVDTAMPAWILDQPPAKIGAGLHDRFVAMRDAGLMPPPTSRPE
jgi:NAD(P)-dependent dehydrogenase (short-subunit alcohol dehydrogenase family)